MRFTYLPLLLLALPLGASAAPSSTWTKIWNGPVEKIADHWTVPSLDARLDGVELVVSVGIAVGSTSELSAKDVAIELRAGTRTIACTAEPMGFTETLAITAQPGAHCRNPGKLIPTELVVTVKGTAHAFPIKLASLKTP